MMKTAKGEIEYDKLGQIACCSTYHFQRMFTYISGMPLSEYIRKRKMSLAAVDLQGSDSMVIRAAAGAYVFHWQIVLTVAVVPAVTLFSLGLSYFLSALYVFFRDLKHIYSVILTLWTYMTPLFYTIETLKNDLVEKVLVFNPMYHYVTYFRDVLSGTIPGAMEHLILYAFALVSFAIGYLFMNAVRNGSAAKL